MSELRGSSEQRVAVDASFALKWLLSEPNSPQARQLLAAWVAESLAVIAPTLLIYEVTNVLYQRMRRQQMATTDANEALMALAASRLTIVGGDDFEMARVALEFTHHHHLPATYDAAYLALAARSGCNLWTADERLWNSVRESLSWVHWVGEA